MASVWCGHSAKLLNCTLGPISVRRDAKPIERQSGCMDGTVCKRKAPAEAGVIVRTRLAKSILTVMPFHRIEQLLRVVTDAVFEHGFDIFDVVYLA